MSHDTDTTRWSLPGQMDVPRDELKVQMEVYEETILLRGFEDGANWVRTVSADGIASAFTQHLGLSTGILPKETLWRPPKVWPVALQRKAFKPPARFRIPMPGLVFVCSPGPGAMGLRRQEPSHGSRASALPGSCLQRLQRRAGLSRQPRVPRRGRTDTRVLL